TDREPNPGWRRVAKIALAVALLDWTTKWLVLRTVPVHEHIVVWRDRLAFWHVQNDAFILGLFSDLPLEYRKVVAGFLAVIAAGLLVAIVSRSHRHLPRRRAWAWLFAGLIAGG